jgi:DNA-binding transcriptional ArsR family regulator
LRIAACRSRVADRRPFRRSVLCELVATLEGKVVTFMDQFIERMVRLLAAMRGAGEPAELMETRRQMLQLLAENGVGSRGAEELVRAIGPVDRILLDRWCAVELDRMVHLLGLCSRHPRLRDGGVITSPVVAFVPRLRLAITWSGSLYELLRPLPPEHWPDAAVDLLEAFSPPPEPSDIVH